MFGIFKRRRDDELAQIEAEITAFGEDLARLPLDLDEHGADPDLMADYARALDAYDHAKRHFLGDRDRADAADVLRTLDEGRSTLARVNAVLSGRPLCFFDPRHGPSAQRVAWAPPGGARREIDVCAADAIRLTEGLPPIATGVRPPPAPPRPRPAPTKTAPRPGRRPAPFKVAPPELGKKHHVKGRGDGEALLRQPKWDVPSILIVRLHGGGKVEHVRQGKSQRLADAPLPFRIVRPLSLSTEWPLHLRIKSTGTWSAWLQPGDSAPSLDRTIASRGPFLFRYIGGAAQIQMDHREGGKFSVTELTPEFGHGRDVLSGKGISSAVGELAGSAFLLVEARGEWVIRVA
ncbi:hypothetical protein [Actinomadura bangladeshensis]|uniref:Uncharacterized protein n=1 Tax=Actinomadura bangladeshensis TaxID=453573 RepID=A0A6L9QDD0_9ACTN|nr:hypothetical protein [Actinomadura bangladeshensis]NEA23016.1 hypothetical protein [Actinomadura bangladeshensis]